MEVMDGSADSVFLRSSSGSPTRPFLMPSTHLSTYPKRGLTLFGEALRFMTTTRL